MYVCDNLCTCMCTYLHNILHVHVCVCLCTLGVALNRVQGSTRTHVQNSRDVLQVQLRLYCTVSDDNSIACPVCTVSCVRAYCTLMTPHHI